MLNFHRMIPNAEHTLAPHYLQLFETLVSFVVTYLQVSRALIGLNILDTPGTHAHHRLLDWIFSTIDYHGDDFWSRFSTWTDTIDWFQMHYTKASKTFYEWMNERTNEQLNEWTTNDWLIDWLIERSIDRTIARSFWSCWLKFPLGAD